MVFETQVCICCDIFMKKCIYVVIFATKVRVCCDFCDNYCVLGISASNFSGFQAALICGSAARKKGKAPGERQGLLELQTPLKLLQVPLALSPDSTGVTLDSTGAISRFYWSHSSLQWSCFRLHYRCFWFQMELLQGCHKQAPRLLPLLKLFEVWETNKHF